MCFLFDQMIKGNYLTFPLVVTSHGEWVMCNQSHLVMKLLTSHDDIDNHIMYLIFIYGIEIFFLELSNQFVLTK